MFTNTQRTKLQKQGQAIKDLILDLLNDWLKEHSVEQLAQELGMSPSWVYQAMNPLSQTRFAAEQIPVINALVGGRLMVRVGELSEHILIPCHLVEEMERDCSSVGRIVKEFGEFMAVSGESLVKESITESEANRIWNEASDVAVNVMGFAKAAKRVAKRRTA